MKRFLLFTIIVFSIAFTTNAQKFPKAGTYYLDFIDMEYQGKKFGTCKAIVKGNKIKLYVLTGCHRKHGELIEEGILLVHKSGYMIIGKNYADKNAEEIGGCSDGPRVINFKKKRYETC